MITALRRRDFLRLAALSVAALPREVSAVRHASGVVDVNVSLSRWPLRRLEFDETESLVRKLRSEGVTQAWAGSFEGLVHKDVAGVNQRLAEDCRRKGRGLLRPFGTINVSLPDWKEELRRCADEHRMPGIRLHPNYHGYKLDDPGFRELLRLAAGHRLIVQLAVEMEDERMMHPLMRVAPVDLNPLPGALKDISGPRLVLLNALRNLRGTPLRRIIDAGEVYVEIAMLEGVGGLGNLVEQIPVSRILFGSHVPFFYFKAAALKLKESPLTTEQLKAIQAGNARKLLPR